ncbi:GerAB/ArcD/ProY family transporter [Priestia aryabhattai]|uniref:GerAB/ArcD/ProY family transporter n=1 Tax=Priestia aryabhattai TaxID=412384 RepID=UPI0039A0FFC7
MSFSFISSANTLNFLTKYSYSFTNAFALIIGRFFKVGLFFYATVLGLSHVFKLKNPSPLVFLIGLVVLFYSLSLAQNYLEHGM